VRRPQLPPGGALLVDGPDRTKRHYAPPVGAEWTDEARSGSSPKCIEAPVGAYTQ
jgi:hypothetical protein